MANNTHANNLSAMKGVTKIYNQYEEKYLKTGSSSDRFAGSYKAYKLIRKAVIYLVNAKKYHNDPDFRKPGNDPYAVLIPGVDNEEAEKAAELLIKAMCEYLTSEN